MATNRSKKEQAKKVKPSGDEGQDIQRMSRTNPAGTKDSVAKQGAEAQSEREGAKSASAPKEGKGQQAGVFNANPEYSVDGGKFKALELGDFTPELVYHTADNTGQINPIPVRPTGNIARDTQRFQDTVLNRRGAYVPADGKVAERLQARPKAVQARPSEIQKAIDNGEDFVKDATESGVSSSRGRVADANKGKLAK